MTPNDALSPGGARVIASGAAVFAYAPGGGPFTLPAGAWNGAALDLTTGASAARDAHLTPHPTAALSDAPRP